MKLAFAGALTVLSACAAASGYDANRYSGGADAGFDPETAPLPSSPRTTIPDPKRPPKTATPPPESAPVAEDAGSASDATTSDAGRPKPKTK
jgi:hypothetical protein